MNDFAANLNDLPTLIPQFFNNVATKLFYYFKLIPSWLIWTFRILTIIIVIYMFYYCWKRRKGWIYKVD